MRVMTANSWLEIRQERPCSWDIIGNGVTRGDNYLADPIHYGYSPIGEGVVDLDAGRSDASQCFNVSNHVRVGEVDLVGSRILAPNLETLLEALKNVSIIAYCPGDI